MARILMTLTLLMGLAACETAEGFVEDSENVGDAVTQTF
ncbi:entericidin [Jannaschia rubra]|uniref:Uncharacterized protein n=1 Tax=Jannaschia rubra TaxID=282197 RepID=A0A0M6XMY8_9RHOB|nr:entericidin [Jannaschia rubra]CTQ31543.1 hypothetical protein JAN5088_00301 [Jannaschia rubra]